MDYSQKSIIVIDDMSTLREAITTMLRKAGFKNILQSVNGADALEKIKLHYEEGNKLDMIFSDINMPKMDGLQLLKTLKSDIQFQNIPVVMISTENESEVVINAIANGAANYIIKPFTADTLTKKLTELKKFF